MWRNEADVYNSEARGARRSGRRVGVLLIALFWRKTSFLGWSDSGDDGVPSPSHTATSDRRLQLNQSWLMLPPRSAPALTFISFIHSFFFLSFFFLCFIHSPSSSSSPLYSSRFWTLNHLVSGFAASPHMTAHHLHFWMQIESHSVCCMPVFRSPTLCRTAAAATSTNSPPFAASFIEVGSWFVYMRPHFHSA